MAENQPRRLSPRFDLEEEPGDAHLGPRQPWIGAFERVLGDQECLSNERINSRSTARSVPPANPVIAAAAAPESRNSQRISHYDDVQDPARSSVASSNNSNHSSGRSSPAISNTTSDPTALQDNFTRRLIPTYDSSTPEPTLLTRYQTNSSNDSTSAASFPPSSVNSTHNPPSYISTSVAHAMLQKVKTPNSSLYDIPTNSTWSRPASRVGAHPSLAVAFSESGPSLVSTSAQGCITFDQAYANHAPCLSRIKVTNHQSNCSVLVKLDSDLKKGVSFMRRKRPAPKHDFEPVAWPSNSLAWAHAGGLSPDNLRGWRHVIANLENADVFILDPQTSTDLYVVLRPSEFTDDVESDQLSAWPYRPPPSPSIIESGRLDRSLDDNLSTRFDALNLPSISPVSTPAAIGDQRGFFSSTSSDQSTADSTGDSLLASPRSAPELNSQTLARSSVMPARPLHPAFHLQGRITLQAWSLPNLENASPKHQPTDPSHPNWSSTTSSRPPSFYGSNLASPTASSLLTLIREPPDEQCIQNICIPLRAKCCKPFIDAAVQAPPDSAPSNTGIIKIDFGDVIVGQSQTQTLTLRNLSEIDTFCQIKLEEADNMLQHFPFSLIDSDDATPVPSIEAGDDEPSTTPLVLPPLEFKRIKVTLKPQEPCKDYEQMITITNLHNASNSMRIVIRANMLGVAKDDILTVLSGDHLDFGDCYGGHWTKQLLILKNNADVLLDVSFGVQKGYEVNFQLAELATQIDEEDIPHEQEARPNSVISQVSVGSTSQDHRGPPSSYSACTEFTTSDYAQSFGPPMDYSLEASELTKTPTHYAQVANPESDPPKLELSSLNDRQARFDKHHAATGCDERDDVDASSVASQAGSRSNSPHVQRKGPPHPSPTMIEPCSKETLATRLEQANTGQMNFMGRIAKSRATSESDQASVSTTHHSQLSSNVFSKPSSRGHRIELKPTENERIDDGTSSKSETTALSQDSRLGPFVSTTSHAGSVTSSSRTHRSGAGAILSGLRNVEQAHSNQLEELMLRPGGEYRVFVAYRPLREPTDEEYSKGRLVERSFRISLDYSRTRIGSARSKGGRERRTVLCHSRTCTSFISICPKLIDIGEVQVGTRKIANVSVTNRSELTARIDLRFVSKVLSMYRDEVAIPALQTVDLKVESFPRRVNETYRKQITVANLLNRQDDQIFEVRSRNVDKQRISFHSLFYRILTPTGSNFIDFGDVNINSTRSRTISIENLSGSKLALELTAAHPEDVTLYVKASREKKNDDAAANTTPSETSALGRSVSKYAEAKVSDAVKQSDNVEPKGKSTKPPIKGADRKERFLETISVDSSTSARRENASWRLAQKHSHYRRKEGSTSVSASRKSNGQVKPKLPINLVSALKKGNKGRITITYGKSVTFKDRTLISEFEYLDLATGPPVDARRIHARSKRYQTLEILETGGKAKGSSTSSASKAPKAHDGNKPDAKESKKGKSLSGAAKPSEPSSGSSSNQCQVSPASSKDLQLKRSLKNTKCESQSNGKTVLTSSKGEVAGSKQETTTRVHFSPALTAKRKATPVLSNPVDVSRLSLEDLLAAVEAQNSMLSTFFLASPESEEQHVRTEINLQRELQSVIEAGQLVPVEVLNLEAGQEKQVVAVYHPNGSTRPHIQGNARKQDSRIFIKLVEFDPSVVKASGEFAGMAELEIDELPVRDLMMRSNTCRSLLELGQPHINFGHMEKGDSKARKILIQNRSEWALRYCIRKSGSIASGDIKLSSGRYGVVPGYGKREVEFVFSPTMSGQFQEKLVVENVGDRDDDQTLVLKANVRKVPNFAVDPCLIGFGACSPGRLSTPESFVLTNTTAKSRTFVIAIDPHDMLFQRCIVDVALSTASDGDVRGTLTKEEEEEIEHLSQKLKIASRKGNLDKVKKYEERLVELGVKPPVTNTNNSLSMQEEKADDGDKDALTKTPKGDPMQADMPDEPNTPPVSSAPAFENQASRLKLVSSTVTCTVGPNQSKRLVLRVRPSAVQSAIGPGSSDPSDRRSAEKAGVEEIEVAVKVHEVKNQDETKVVVLRANVEFELDACATCFRDGKVKEPMPSDAVVFSPLQNM